MLGFVRSATRTRAASCGQLRTRSCAKGAKTPRKADFRAVFRLGGRARDGEDPAIAIAWLFRRIGEIHLLENCSSWSSLRLWRLGVSARARAGFGGFAARRRLCS